MNYKLSTRKNRKRKKNNNIFIGIVITVCIIVSIYLLSVITIPGISKISGNVVNGLTSVFSTIGGFFNEGTSYFGSVKKLNNEVDKLKADLEIKSHELLAMEILEKENEDLKQLLKIDDKYSHFKKVYANVLYRSYDNWNETFVINKGKVDGLKLKQTVITAEGLVGYVSEVTDKTSVVRTILDPSTSVSVEISSINSLALTKGDFTLKNVEQMKLINIPIDAEVSVSETIYTSGIGEVYKKGIPVGIIKEVVNKKNEIDRYAIIDTLVKFSSIDTVAIIVD